jgi:Protein of unknown function (DUF1320)
MTWVTPRQALQMIGQKKLAQFTNEAGQQELVGVGDGVKTAFTTPFIFGLDLKVYADSVLTYAVTVDFTKGERLVATFTVAPAVGVVITASSLDSVNADNLDSAFLRAQGDVRGMVDAALYVVPPDTPGVLDPPVPSQLIGWAAAIAWYYLAADPRRPRLLEAYPEMEKRYIDVFGGLDATLKRVARGDFSLRGVLPARDTSLGTPDVGVADFSSNAPVYSPTTFRGPG